MLTKYCAHGNSWEINTNTGWNLYLVQLHNYHKETFPSNLKQQMSHEKICVTLLNVPYQCNKH